MTWEERFDAALETVRKRVDAKDGISDEEIEQAIQPPDNWTNPDNVIIVRLSKMPVRSGIVRLMIAPKYFPNRIVPLEIELAAINRNVPLSRSPDMLS